MKTHTNQHMHTGLSVMKKQTGFSLVELMVGLVLSIFIGVIAVTYFVTSSQAFRVNTNETIIQENARFALETLSREIRHAGLNPATNDSVSPTVIFTDSICRLNERGGRGRQPCTRDGEIGDVMNNSDRFAIDYIVDASMAADPAIGVGARDVVGCNSENITVPFGSVMRLASVYWSADLDGDNVRSLYCQTRDAATGEPLGAPLPIVEGVERLQVQYGVDANGDGTVDRYQSYNNLTDAASGGVANIANVRAIRVGLLINSGLSQDLRSGSETNAARMYTVLDGALETFTDVRLRQIYSATIDLPNAG